jgi:C4-dicarboxylate-specific signal transduction histidine kinase
MPVTIRDNGTGIPPEVREKMFTPFFATKPAGEGPRPLLSHDIIVRQHAGSIEVETPAEPDSGGLEGTPRSIPTRS